MFTFVTTTMWWPTRHDLQWDDDSRETQDLCISSILSTWSLASWETGKPYPQNIIFKDPFSGSLTFGLRVSVFRCRSSSTNLRLNLNVLNITIVMIIVVYWSRWGRPTRPLMWSGMKERNLNAVGCQWLTASWQLPSREIVRWVLV